jgi:sodium-dependent dicarboxylate transporter 2/3/5
LIPPIFIYLVYRWIYPPERFGDNADLREHIAREWAGLGRITRNEKITIAILLLAVFFWVTRMFGVSSWVVALVAGALFQMPGIEITNWRKAKDTIPWQIIILFAAAISLGNLMFKTRAAAWLAEHTLLAWGLGNWGLLAAVFVTMFTIHIFHAGIVSASPMYSLLLPPFIIFAKQMGWNPVTLSLLIVFNIHMPHILPISLEPSMVVFGSGYYKFTDTIRPGIILTVIWVLLSMACAAFWPWLKLR